MLVEQSWLEGLPGEFQIFDFKGSASSAVNPPQHLIFNALNTTPFHPVKVVILGQASCHKITLVGVCKVQNGEAAVVKHLGSDWFNRDIGESE
ncbi:uracil-DNA glycosylase, putative [Medicago truncatula]|uniref:Uracil-DNA glycosylase, putative n=2 Tax=Medicago truncatula TaxID=3880 RepID=A0A072ULB5_MEDTR|nr:uracil-DNA glycosylase, putative [Medicago truncatula]